MSGVYAVITANTAANPTQVTLDRWYTPSNPGGSAASTPSTGTWLIAPGMAPASWVGITTDTGSPSLTDTTLPSEETTNGLARGYATLAHTAGATSSTLTITFTYTGSTSKTLHKVGTFNAAAGGPMVDESVLSNDALVSASGNTATVTLTVQF